MLGKVEICGVNTSKLKTLKNEEMMELLRRSKQGDEDARQRLVEGNLRLVLSVIQKFIGRGENPDDSFQVGCIGLLKAIICSLHCSTLYAVSRTERLTRMVLLSRRYRRISPAIMGTP